MAEFVYKEPEFRLSVRPLLSVLNFDIFITFTSLNRNIARSARTLPTAIVSLSLLQIPHTHPKSTTSGSTPDAA